MHVAMQRASHSIRMNSLQQGVYNLVFENSFDLCQCRFLSLEAANNGASAQSLTRQILVNRRWIFHCTITSDTLHHHHLALLKTQGENVS